ncbi:MAG: FGGY-family carbohydrate kinase [Atopobiaceae bacterium]|jgi:sugar (pentulose or hexulose) kinase|nr:ATPase [Atopobiaceae bacterium]MCH4119681.1 ATPase [Atopobiaceae bacterium]MCI1319009.1 FGGY-family carbohydrate kinase [Atopobiaceae bacterium]MCI1388752.1 FGGY-family carbohydrate kinase [Atopobiaceae bacterium]MCI1432628.1 FGGY-family carbohydrate kinase [Atopobiaceae bacterium]
MEQTQFDLARDAIAQGKAAMGMEFGSTRIKAVLVDEDSRPLAVGTYDWENSYVDGHWTYAEDEIWAGLAGCYESLKEDVRARYGVRLTRLAGLGVSAMMHGYLAFDAQGRLLVPFRTWRDTTTTQAAHELTRAFGFHIPERWSVSHLYQAILDGEEHVGQVAELETLAGMVHWRLTGRRVLSVGDASGMFPIDSATGTYDERMAQEFDRLAAEHGADVSIVDLLPGVLKAGEVAGHLTDEGARLLDPTGELESGCPVCPPEGDAGTGMIATDSVAPRTGNVSAGTSVFSMVVLERPLKDATVPEIDLVTTPVGDAVAMVHCNSCTSDINAWVSLFRSFAQSIGHEVGEGEAFTRLFELALEGESDGGGIVSVPFVSGETVMGVSVGHPLLVRMPDAHLTLENFMRASIMSAFGALAAGNVALRREGVAIDRLYAHGGIFKTPKVAQRILAAALEAPVTVMDTASEGGAWGQAVAVNYMLHKEDGQGLADYLDSEVFGEVGQSTIEPDPADVEGFRAYLARFRAANEAELACERAFGA